MDFYFCHRHGFGRSRPDGLVLFSLPRATYHYSGVRTTNYCLWVSLPGGEPGNPVDNRSLGTILASPPLLDQGSRGGRAVGNSLDRGPVVGGDPLLRGRDLVRYLLHFLISLLVNEAGFPGGVALT